MPGSTRPPSLKESRNASHVTCGGTAGAWQSNDGGQALPGIEHPGTWKFATGPTQNVTVLTTASVTWPRSFFFLTVIHF
jgi:hypothetical protein